MSFAEEAGKMFHQTTGAIKNGIIRRGRGLRSAVSLEGVGLGLLQGAEELRAQYINPDSSMYSKYVQWVHNQPLPPPLLSPENFNSGLYEVLTHVGDMWEGYLIPYAVHTLSTILLVEVSPKIRLGVAIGVANAVIAAHELGLLNGQKPDPADIPAGVIGSIIYLLIHNATEKKLREIDAEKAKLKPQETELGVESPPVNVGSDVTPAPSALVPVPSDNNTGLISPTDQEQNDNIS